MAVSNSETGIKVVHSYSEEYKSLRREFAKVKKALIGDEWKKCCNCGSDESVEIHHVVPILVGGTNRISNLVPLCYKCHVIAHGGTARKYKRKDTLTGRPRKKYDKQLLDRAFDLYVKCEIGARECKEMIGMAKGSHITDMEEYINYLKERNIKLLRNNIDIILSNRDCIKDGDVTGYMVINHKKHDIIYHGEPKIKYAF